MTTTADWLSFQLAAAVDGRSAIVFMDVLASAVPLADALRDHGALRVLVIAGSRGTGAIDEASLRDVLVMDLAPARDLMTGIRSFLTVMERPPQDVVEAIEAFDPERQAIVVGPLYAEAQQVVGRPVFGARPWPWQKLEDKTVADDLWDRAGVARAPARIVHGSLTELLAAAEEVQSEAGSVWAADNRTGWHGGGAGTRWVTEGVDPRGVAAELGLHADQVRVMPFLEGLPCSIHGWVIGSQVMTFRPVEMVVLRDLATHALVYGGAATTWQPSAATVASMQDVARRVGETLRDEVSYRGSFTVDGVLTDGGFLPTELNPRYGAGLGVQARAMGLPLYLLHCATIARPDLDWRPDEFQTLVRDAALENPLGAAHVLTTQALTDRTLHLRVEGGRFVVADAGPVTVVTGPAPGGGMVKIELHDDLGGRPTGLFAAAALNACADVVRHGLPPLSSAPLAP